MSEANERGFSFKGCWSKPFSHDHYLISILWTGSRRLLEPHQRAYSGISTYSSLRQHRKCEFVEG